MSDELNGVDPLVLRPPALGDVDAVGPTLIGAFAEIRAALEAGRPVAVVVDAGHTQPRGQSRGRRLLAL